MQIRIINLPVSRYQKQLMRFVLQCNSNTHIVSLLELEQKESCAVEMSIKKWCYVFQYLKMQFYGSKFSNLDDCRTVYNNYICTLRNTKFPLEKLCLKTLSKTKVFMNKIYFIQISFISTPLPIPFKATQFLYKLTIALTINS